MLGTLMHASRSRRRRGLTLVELLIVVVVLAVLATLAAPSFRDMILMQRLRGTHAQLVTDLQLARSEAVSRGLPVRVSLRSSDADLTCYVLYTLRRQDNDSSTTRCDCSRTPGTACSQLDASLGATEVRTVQVTRQSGVTLAWTTQVAVPTAVLVTPEIIAFEPVRGSAVAIAPGSPYPGFPATAVITTRVDDPRQLRALVGVTGRPTVCAPNPQRMQEAACPP